VNISRGKSFIEKCEKGNEEAMRNRRKGEREEKGY